MAEKTKDFAARRYKLADVAKSGETATKTVFYTTDSTSGSVWVVKPGQEVAAHEHPAGDDFWVCIQGTGVFIPHSARKFPSSAATSSLRKGERATAFVTRGRRTLSS